MMKFSSVLYSLEYYYIIAANNIIYHQLSVAKTQLSFTASGKFPNTCVATQLNVSKQIKQDSQQLLQEIDDDVLDYVGEAQEAMSSFDFEQFEAATESVVTASGSTPVKNSLGIFVPPCTNRTFWNRYTMPSYVLQAVQYFMHTPMPNWSDSAYLLYRKTGDRLTGQDMLWSRQSRLPYLVLAECKYNNGTFLPAVESTLVALSTQRSWAYPAADYHLNYFYGTSFFMDLSSASMAENIGLAFYMLKDSLSSTTKSTVLNALYTRVFNPLKAMFQSNDSSLWSKFWWVSSNSNHNAVIWAAVLITSFCVQNSTDRSFFAQKGIRYSNSYLNSFWADGYASEGVGYWNYGFLNYALVRQTLYEGTGGAYDAFRNPKAASAALFSKEFGMSYGDAANFGDCHFGVYFSSSIVRYVDRSFQQVQASGAFQMPKRSNGLNLAYYLPSLIPANIPVAEGRTTSGMAALRRYYNESGVLVVRPNNSNNGQGLYGTMKLCGNFGGHSHDDIGSYVISVNGVKLTGDVGGPLYYDATTFSSKRYSNPLMNSYGHPVPVVNGNLQRRATVVCNSGTKSVRVLGRNFTKSMDTITYNLKGAYYDSSLKSLTRKFVYSRQSSIIIITDKVEFSKPSTFEDALVSQKSWKFTSNSTGYFIDANQTLFVSVISDTPFVLNRTKLTSYKVNFTRIGIHLSESVSYAKVTVIFSTKKK